MSKKTQKAFVITLAILSILAIASSIILPFLPIATGQ